jgi:RNA polymerase sigma-70 factor (sigma-E family)
VQRWHGGPRFSSVNATIARGDDPGARAGATAEQARNATAAVTDLFREHHLELVRMAIVMLGDPATAEDVVQDAFERLHRRWPRLREPVDGLAYVRSSVLNGCRSVHRRAAVARRHAPELARTGSAAGPENAATARSQLLMAMRSLPPRQREVLVLRFYVDLDVAEIATTLRIAPSAVRSNCSRGLAALGRTLRRDGK